MTGTALYDRIGRDYNATRRADPSIVAAIGREIGLRPGMRVLDAACGTGNYTVALAAAGGAMVGLDISHVMLAEARKQPGAGWVAGREEALPFADASFDAVTCVNAVHHFADADAAFCEFRRVLRPGGHVAMFTNTAEEVLAFWVARYFPGPVRRSAATCLPEARFANLAALSGLRLVARVPWLQPRDPVDLFLYCGKHRPELYLDPAVRAGISTFASQASADDVSNGVARLAADIASGAIGDVIAAASRRPSDYSIFVYARSAA